MSKPADAATGTPNQAETWTILRVLEWTKQHFEKKGITSARLDAELILAHVLSCERVMLYARFDQPLGPEELTKIRSFVARRARYEPVAYLLGQKEFWSLDFEVDRNVLIPRPDTETLVEVALSALKNRNSPKIIDVGTGSGNIAVALAKELSSATVWAFDISESACALASRNVERHGLKERVHVTQSDLFEKIPFEGTVDLICANLPYIEEEEWTTLSPEVRDFEPTLALLGGRDGLDIIRRLIDGARSLLSSGGTIVLEAGTQQVPALVRLLENAGYREARGHRDAGNLWRVAEAQSP